MTNEDICPECNRPVPQNAPAGICPHCLLQAGMESPAHEPTHLQQFHPPEVTTLSPLFDQLEIESLLGQGGMGAVYRARQLKLDRLVALKLLHPESSANNSFAERFNREARTLARLSHPQIVGVHDFGELQAAAENEPPQTLYYFLMEYVKGENLRQLMQSGPLPAERAISIVAQVCEALQYAHEEGVIHRDIKPENILIDARGRVKIADFGLAKLATPSEHDFTLTGTHQVMGTPRYMAPEQMAGSQAIDHRADLYSLGVVFYEMLTGEIPAGHFSSPSQHAAIDGCLDNVVMKALAQKSEERFQSASEIRSSLEAIAQDETESVVSEPKTPVPARGFSTIFEREIGAAWNWVVHPEKKSEGASNKNEAAAFPLLLFLTLSLLGGLTILLPWAEIHVDQGVDVSRIVRDAKLAGPVVQERFGTDIWSSTAAPITFLVLVLVIALAPTRKSPGIILSGLLVLFSVVALIHTLAFTQEIKHQPAITLPLSMSSLEAEFLRNSGESGDQQYDPEANAAAPREIVNQKVSPRAIEHSLIYREGFYSALGISLTLVVLNIVSVRNAILNREPKPTTTESWSGTPLESLGFSVPSQGDIGTKVKFHFLGQGYELAKERPGVWIFQRGRTMSAIFDSDIRLYPTRLTVNSIDTDREELLVNCHWSVRLMGGWARKKDIKILEDEGRKLQTLLGGQIDEPTDASVSEKRFGKRIDDTDVPDVSPRDESPPDSDRAEIDVVAVEEEVGSPAMAMIVFGLLSLLGHIGLIIFSLSNRSTADNVWAFFPGILPALLMVIGGLAMRKRGSLSWSRIGIIGGFLPLSATWIISAVISTWAHQTLQKPHVKRAFLERARQRQRESNLRQKSLTSTFLFVLFVLVMTAGILIGGFMVSSRKLSRHDAAIVLHKPPEAVLHDAAAQGDIKQVKQSLDVGADINNKDNHGQTPLMNAAMAGDPRMVAYLMLRGADEQARDPEGKTALMYAVELGHSDVVRMLLDLEQSHYDEEVQFRLSRIGPDVADTINFSKLRFDVGRNLVDGQGESPLMKAAATGESDIIESLLLFSDDTLQDSRGRTAIMHAIERRQEAVLAPHFDKANAWLDALKPGNEYAGFIRPQSLAIADNDGRTPLERAEQLGLEKTAARIEGYLKSVIDRSTRLIEEDAQNSQAHYHHRALAYKALGETEKAETDFKASREPE